MKKFFILFAAVALIGAFALPATAGSEWSFYGSARMHTYYNSYDEDAGDDSDLEWYMAGNSRFGGRAKAGDISGQIEYGGSANLRHLNGKWNFGAGYVLVGQTTSPYLTPSSQVYDGDAGLLNAGGFWIGRDPMLKLGVGGFALSLITPTTTNYTGGDVDTILPMIGLQYKFSAGPASLKFIGVYQTYSIEGSTGDVDINAYAGGAEVYLTFGPAHVGLVGLMAQNMASMGAWVAGDAAPVVADGNVEDTTSVAGMGIAGFKATDALSFEGGAGYVVHSNDTEGRVDDDTLGAYVQAKVTIAPGFFVVPEVGYYDYGEGCMGVEEGTMTYFGAKWQINF